MSDAAPAKPPKFATCYVCGKATADTMTTGGMWSIPVCGKCRAEPGQPRRAP